MVANKLKLNCDKTVVVLFKPKSQNPDHQPQSLLVGNDIVKISDHFASLGVVFDSHMKMERQANSHQVHVLPAAQNFKHSPAAE